jgi:hypothetical protein
MWRDEMVYVKILARFVGLNQDVRPLIVEFGAESHESVPDRLDCVKKFTLDRLREVADQ